MTKYVLGFMFNEKETDVLLIEKQKPLWQKGKLNGIGGKIEDGESPAHAMYREFKEEVGIECVSWKYIVTMGNPDWHADTFDAWSVDVFMAKSNDVFYYKQMEQEMPVLIRLDEFDKFNLISNLYWLIPMCLDKNDDHKSGINYNISNYLHP